jgi:lipopolysaccharide assembly outer membrane protein LptD (OstA)
MSARIKCKKPAGGVGLGRLVSLCAALAWAGGARVPLADETPAPDGAVALPEKSADIELRHAGEMEYAADGWVHARGGVRIVSGDQSLRADVVKFHTQHRLAFAEGHVVFTGADGETWRGEKLQYDFAAGKAVLDGASGQSAPFRLLHSEKVEHEAGHSIVLYDCRITTCKHDLPHAHYHVRARKVEIRPGDSLKVYGARWYFGRMPVMYLPYWRRNLADRYGLDVQPGYRSRMGYYALFSYSYPISEEVDGATLLDYRTRRGFAVGQDFSWRDSRRSREGGLRLYYADDQDPDYGAPPGETSDIPSERYRIRARHRQTLSRRDTLRLQAHWLSDAEVLEDFFVREYRRSRQPENFAAYTRRGETYIVDLLVRQRFNDFYADVNRTPELSLRLLRREIGNSGIYYESQSAAARLERVWPEADTNAVSYAANRIDTSHMLYRPQKIMGFLQWVPRAGYRLTHYSQTRLEEEDAETGEIVFVDGGGAVNRSIWQAGSELSYKAFKTWSGGLVSPLRHVAEPYADYTLVPKPSVDSRRVYSFDAVDDQARNHSVLVGMRNKWQTKIDESPYNLVDLDVRTRLRLEADREDGRLDPLLFDLRVRPLIRGLTLDVDGRWDFYESALDRVNLAVKAHTGERTRVAAEYRVRRDESALLLAGLDFDASAEWSWGLGGRYEFEGGRLEDVEASSMRTWDCMALRAHVGFVPSYERADGRHREDEWRFALEFWLTAFPEMRLRSQ